MNNELRSQIHNSMSLKETSELVDIWQRHDSTEWSDLAFNVVEEILRDRLGELPPQSKFSAEDRETTIVKSRLSTENYKEKLLSQARSYAIVYSPIVITAIFFFSTTTKDNLVSHIVIILLSMIFSSILIIIRQEIPRLPPFESIRGRKATTMGFIYLFFFVASLIFYIIVNVFNL